MARERPVSRPTPGHLVLAGVALVGATAAIEWWMGRLPLGPDGRIALWESNIWSAAMSQRIADPYSFSHVLHGLVFYAGLRLAAPTLPLGHRALAAVALEAGWEVLENSPLIINRYREATIALGYEGDSILNSASDILMMAGGFWLAARLKVSWSIAVFLALELGMLVTLRDNLTLNVIMLVSPIDAIRDWQMAGGPVDLGR